MPEDVLDPANIGIPAGAVVTSAMVIAEYVVPGEDPDEPEAGPSLWIFRDSVSGAWKHLGMLQIAADNIRDDFRGGDDG